MKRNKIVNYLKRLLSFFWKQNAAKEEKMTLPIFLPTELEYDGERFSPKDLEEAMEKRNRQVRTIMSMCGY